MAVTVEDKLNAITQMTPHQETPLSLLSVEAVATKMPPVAGAPLGADPQLVVAWIGPFLYPTGYGEACRLHAKALQAAGVTVLGKLHQQPPLGLIDELVKDDHAVNQILDPAFWPNPIPQPDAWVWHVTADSFVRSEDGKPNLGYCAWEIEGLPAGWAEATNKMDGLLTPSAHSARIFREAGVTVPIYICPHPIDIERYNPQLTPTIRPLFPETDTLFLVVAQWMFRKGIEDILIAYGSEFKPSEKVGLAMLAWRWGHQVSEHRAVIAYAQHVLRSLNVSIPKVWIIGDKLSSEAMPDLYASADVFISGSRGEAFCLPIFQAAACGKPTITTAYGGQWDYLSDQSAYRIEHIMETVSGAGPKWRHYNAQQKWGRPIIDSLRQQMRRAHEDKEGRAAKGSAAFESVAEHLSYAAAGQAMVNAITTAIDRKSKKE